MSGAHTVVSGDRLTLSCESTASNPRAEITWYDARGRQLTRSVTSATVSTAVGASHFLVCVLKSTS